MRHGVPVRKDKRVVSDSPLFTVLQPCTAPSPILVAVPFFQPVVVLLVSPRYLFKRGDLALYLPPFFRSFASFLMANLVTPSCCWGAVPLAQTQRMHRRRAPSFTACGWRGCAIKPLRELFLHRRGGAYPPCVQHFWADTTLSRFFTSHPNNDCLLIYLCRLPQPCYRLQR